MFQTAIIAGTMAAKKTGSLIPLVQHRNPSKTATAFFEPNGHFPEPLLTIWEPRSYPVLLQASSQGYTCPRKVLINGDVEMLYASDTKDFTNVSDPAAYETALSDIKTVSTLH